MERVLDEISFQAPDLFKSPRPEATQEGVDRRGRRLRPARRCRAADALAAAARHRAPDGRRHVEKVIVVDPEYVRQQVASIVKDQDLSRYIL